MTDEVTKQAADLALKAEHYSHAFTHARRIVLAHGGENSEILAKVFSVKSELEAEFAQQLRTDPIGTMAREGLA